MHRPSCTVNLSLLSWLKAFWLILYQRKCCFLCDLLKTVKCTLLKFAYGVSRMRPNWAMAFVTGASGESCGIPLKHPAPSRHIATSLWSHSPGLFMFRNFQESQYNTSTTNSKKTLTASLDLNGRGERGKILLFVHSIYCLNSWGFI